MHDLGTVIPRIVERMKKHRSLYEQNEMATRNQIVDPTLRNLGWDPEDPAQVHPNESMEEGVPDYSLLQDDKKVLFVEAKKLSVDIEAREVLRQLAKYCFGEGMKYGVLTNGAVWVLFRAFQEGTTMAERIVWKTDIENDEVTAIVRRLSTISRDHIGDIDKLIEKLQILDEIWQSLLDEPKNLSKGFVPVFEDLIREGYPDYDFGATELEDFIQERVKEMFSPQADTPTRIPEPPEWKPTGRRSMTIDRQPFEVRNSYDILVNTAEWLVAKRRLSKDNCPVVGGHKRNLVNTEPKHRYGESFRAPRELSNGLYIETHASTASCITNARKLLQKCGFAADLLEVR